jgi:uncharacterized protein YPO0396
VRERERKREKRMYRWVVCDTAFNRGENRARFMVMKVPRKCPLVLLLKVVWNSKLV